MAGTELITGMEELVNHIRELEAKNKELTETNECVKRQIETVCKVNDELKEENKKLKIPDGVVRAFKGLVVNWWEDEEKYYRENFHMKEKYDGDPGNIPTKYLSDCNYTDLRILNDWIVGGKYEKYEIEESSSEEEEDSEEEYTIEINVVGLGWCRYIDEEDRDKHVVYCKNGLWKMKGDKTAKDCEGNYCETDDEE